MFYFIFGTDFTKREKARESIKQDLKKKGIETDSLLEVPKINSENYTILPTYFGEASLFGEKIIVNITDMLSREENREYLYKNIGSMVDSNNIFILDEPFALAASAQKITRDLEKINMPKVVYDASEKKVTKDVDPFYLCDLIERRDKKGAWLEWKKLYEEWKDKEAMAIQGALWWKWKNMWMAKIDGDRRNYFSIYKVKTKEIMYKDSELEKWGKEISLMAMRATNGEINLMRAIENFILKI